MNRCMQSVLGYQVGLLAVLVVMLLTSSGEADQTLGAIHNDSLTSYLLTQNSYIQGVRPLVEQRGVQLDGVPRLTAGSPVGGGGGNAPVPGSQALPPVGDPAGGDCGGGAITPISNPLGGLGGNGLAPGGSSGGVSLKIGTANVGTTNISLPSSGLRWIVGISYNARQDDGSSHVTSDGPQGKDWFQNSMPEIRKFAGATADKDIIYLFYAADRFLEFKRKDRRAPISWVPTGPRV